MKTSKKALHIVCNILLFIITQALAIYIVWIATGQILPHGEVMALSAGCGVLAWAMMSVPLMIFTHES